MDFFKFVLPFLWRGGLIIKINTILTILLLIAAKGMNVIHPLILKMVIDEITLGDSSKSTQANIFFLIGMYTLTRFSSDFINYIREIPFATVAASAEIYVADMVYNHVQHQSLAFHLSRETGKVIRIVSRGSQSFAAILRYTCFSLGPIILELTFVLGVIAAIYPW
jgi:ATP-binding cassette subfamily B protein